MILIGLLQAQACLAGYDAAAHLSEETKQGDVAGAWGMIWAIVVSTALGWIFLIACYLGIHDYQTTLHSRTEFPFTQILLDNFGRELTIFFGCLLIVVCWLGGIASIAANSRMIYAFSRDKAIVSINIENVQITFPSWDIFQERNDERIATN